MSSADAGREGKLRCFESYCHAVGLTGKPGFAKLEMRIAGTVASMTEGELAGTEMKEFPMSCLG